MSVAEEASMRNQLLKATLLPLLITAACGVSNSTDDKALAGDDSCDACSGDHGGDSGGGSGGGGGGGSAGGDVSVNADLDADLDITVVGSGIYVNVLPLSCLQVQGDFTAHAKARANFDGNSWVVADVNADASIDLGNGCSCSNLNLSANATASVKVHASIDANVNACARVCLGHDDSCASTCDHDGNRIVADVDLDANACASVNVNGDLDINALAGLDLDLHANAVVDVNGNVVVKL
jgi:hypothetical protein